MSKFCMGDFIVNDQVNTVTTTGLTGNSYTINRIAEASSYYKPRFHIGDIVLMHDPFENDIVVVGEVVDVTRNTSTHIPVGRLVREGELFLYDIKTEFNGTYINIPEKELIEKMMRYRYMSGTKIEMRSNIPEIKKVHFSNGVTVVIFEDGTKSIVKCQEGETFDPEKGLAMAIAKKALGTNKSGSNYYDEFKKWLPKEEEKKVGPIDVTLNTGHSIVLDPANPCVGCTDRKNGCLTGCQKMQEYVDGIREESKPEPIEPGYFLKHSEERKNRPKPVAGNPVPVKKEDPVPLPISTFVDKFEGALFPQEFISFCKKNGLAFYIVDEIKGGLKKIDPYRVTWQQVTGYLKRGLMESCKKVKCHKNATTSFLAVYMDKALFSKIISKEEN